MRAQINSDKHIFQKSIATVAGGAVDGTVLATAVAVGDVNTVAEVRTGCTIKAVYVELWVRTLDTASGSFVFTIEKQQGSGSNPTAITMAALHDYDNKKNVLFSSQGLVNDQNSVAMPILRQWIKIPKGKQRFGQNDRLRVTVFAQSLIDLAICGLFIYKEYY